MPRASGASSKPHPFIFDNNPRGLLDPPLSRRMTAREYRRRRALRKQTMTEIRVPTLGESVTEATIGRWFKKAGEGVGVDEPLVELETDKVTIEVPAPSAGTLGDIIAKDGETVAVGALLGQINDGAAGGAPKTARRPRQGGGAGSCAGRSSANRQGPACGRATRAVGAQAFSRKRHRCGDRSRFRQGWPGYQGRHAGRDRKGRLSADAGQSAGSRRAGSQPLAGG